MCSLIVHNVCEKIASKYNGLVACMFGSGVQPLMNLGSCLFFCCKPVLKHHSILAYTIYSR